jgi:hypothetical protein
MGVLTNISGQDLRRLYNTSLGTNTLVRGTDLAMRHDGSAAANFVPTASAVYSAGADDIVQVVGNPRPLNLPIPGGFSFG